MTEPMWRTAVNEEQEGLRIDKWLQEQFSDYSRMDIQRWIEGGFVLVNDIAIKKNHKLSPDEIVCVLPFPQKPQALLEPEDIPLDIVYEDEDIIVINKPRNLVVHPGNGIAKGTLAAALLFHYQKLSSVNGTLRPGIVHRLDKDTAGLMVAARNDAAHIALARQLEARQITRIYNCICWGHPPEEGVIDAPVGRDLQFRLRMKVSSRGREARTNYKVIEYFPFASWMQLKLDTGRTHQIRVHMRSIGHPIMGDPLYDGVEGQVDRVEPLHKQNALRAIKTCSAQMLQAVQLSFNHPRTNQEMNFQVPLLEEFSQVMRYLKESDQN
jgi:23S rRNA pseudouridine1911/1915/1917 synthase